MAQDYAKQRNPDAQRRRPVRAATRTTTSQPSTHWSWFFSGLMAGVIVAIAGYLGVVKLEADAAENAQIAQGSDNPAELPAFMFDFYNDLANAEVAVAIPPPAPGEESQVPAAAVQETQSPAAPTQVLAGAENATNYLLQAGSFQNRQDAENQRARIMLLNMNANVVPGVVSGRTFHRVQVGPFAGRPSTESARDLLSENNIDSILLQIR
jgi:cell division septation protein DedD